MQLGLRIFLGFFLIVGLAAFFTLQVFSQEIKPGVRQAMESTLIDTAYMLAALAADEMANGQIEKGHFAHTLTHLHNQPIQASIWSITKQRLYYRVYITDTQGIVRFDSEGSAIGADYSRWNDVYLTLQGQYGTRSTKADPEDDTSSVMYVAAPILKENRLLGVLTVSKPNKTLAPFIQRSEHKILLSGMLLMGSAFLIGLACTWWLIHSLQKLRRYAQAVEAGKRAQMPLRGDNQLAELGRAVESMRQRLEDKQYVEHYIHTLTHEMKSPLAAISGAAELLQEDIPLTERAHFIHNIERQTQRLTQLIQKLLALAELEQRQTLENSVFITLNTLLKEHIEALTPRAQSRHIKFNLNKNEAKLWGDPFLLGQALSNLLENALDFSPPESIIDINVAHQNHAICITICDQGPGIPVYAMARLFERFYSLPRSEGGEKSTGLGLCFVQEVAFLHQGSIHLENRPQGGVCATLTLPIK